MDNYTQGDAYNNNDTDADDDGKLICNSLDVEEDES
jgi:hypothetical protein